MRSLKIFSLSIIIALIVTTRSNAQDAALSKPINAVIDNYIALKNALAAGDASLAKSDAKTLLSAINSVPVKSMNKSQLAMWTNYSAKLQFDSRHISEVDMLHHQREHFASLSNNLYTVLKDLKLNKAPLYHQYCEMKQQYFISETEKGKDPYMGMSNCSKVKETLPAVK
ncbi:DUF3347 domain-containing protein [Mucilaginibacter sp.]|uniref:DUF3347 domain-containing protein n=1 Tax=Mucilaginibacter sp. TaxID=1882438 RepID=UPI003D0B78DA